MTHELVSVLCGGPGVRVPGVDHPLVDELSAYAKNHANAYSPAECYQALLEQCDADLIVYIHDDVTIHDPQWLNRVLACFTYPECVCVGLGGAAALGHHDLYKSRYQLNNMARRGYISNQTDWQIHGGHMERDKRVAVVDAFFMAVRTDFLRFLGGWPTHHLTHHCLDLWLACEAARHQREVWMTGVSCTHHGGGSSTKPAYGIAKWLQGGTLETDHQRPHKWLYDEYIDVLPIEVTNV